MLKKLVCLTTLVVTLALVFSGSALAQRPSPTATIHQQHLTGKGVNSHHQPLPGSFFYGGDGDPLNGNADGLWNQVSDDLGIDGMVISPFIVPQRAKWNVGVLYVNNEYYPYPPTGIVDAAWAISASPGGTPICSGVATPVLTDTGRLYLDTYEEYTTAVSIECSPLSGTSHGQNRVAQYWENVTVETSVGGGGIQLVYESNVPDIPPPDAVGTPEPRNQSYFFSEYFEGGVLVNANTQGPFAVFSAGVAAATD